MYGDFASFFVRFHRGFVIPKSQIELEQLIPSTDCILEAVEICLKSNHSVFNEKFYLQIHGTAMGPKNACSYADIAMGEIASIYIYYLSEQAGNPTM